MKSIYRKKIFNKFNFLNIDTSFSLDYSKYFKDGSIFVLSLILASNNLILDIYPLGIGLISSVNIKHLPIVAAGSIIGSFFAFDIVVVSKCVAMTLIFVSSRWILSQILNAKNNLSIALMSTLISVILSELPNLLNITSDIYILVNIIISIIILSCSCFLFIQWKGFDIKIFENNKRIILTSILLAFSLQSLDKLFNTNISITLISIYYMSMFFSFFLNTEKTLVFVGTASFIVAILFSDKIYLASALVFSFILAEYFKKYGKLSISLCFFIITTLAFIPFSRQASIFYLIEPLVATLFFLVTPVTGFKKLIKYKNIKIKNVKKINGISEYVDNRLDVMSYSFYSISEEISSFNERIDMINYNDISSVYAKTMEDVCKKCKNKLYCSTTGYNQLYDCFNKLGKKLLNGEKVFHENSHNFLMKTCHKPKEIIDSINNNFILFLQMQQNNKKINSYKENISEQFSFISKAIKNLGKNLRDIDYLDIDMENKLKKYFNDYSIEVHALYVVVEKDGLITVNIDIPNKELNKKDFNFLKSEISLISGIEFDFPVINKAKDSINLIFLQKANIYVDHYVYSTSKFDDVLSGDTSGIFKDISGNVNLVLCDGMGTGDKANLESRITLNIVENLIKTGIDKENSLSIVNAALISKKGDECFSTIDIASINTFTGKTDIFKAGGVSTYVKKGSDVITITSPSMPVGILSKVNYSESQLYLNNRDILVMVSDGVVATGEQWVESVIGTYKGTSPKELAKMIGENAKNRNSELYNDDITVMVSFVEKLA
ncbi:MAG: SpoIIE family protein phosphatase [Oscillospiraceae bacterium]